ncbi:MAG: CPBP family intramembrane metalloprotease [Oryzomonas sp.]|uniref:CPBP family intramembrane glutamic endopeptidase n=1 Tax=Oryzomonas sp. TaxID=2855186 RepID=UPI002840F42F|nr:CPBP family intramembrane glutamic endopeptidase [Oryzomonas sp.]MDR3580679.1 CPBP family intramembrane metalloprotease [Oryzomonas sp.]
MTVDTRRTIKRWRHALEALLPVAAIAAWTWLEPFGHSRILDKVFAVFLGIILLFVMWRDGFPTACEAGIARHGQHMKAIARSVLSVLPLIIILIVWAWLDKRLYVNIAILRALVCYPIGALVQEAAVFVYLLPRLEQAWGRQWGLCMTAILFGALHLPNPLLTVGSILLVFILSWSWRRERSLVALAVAHGLVGAVCNKAVHVSMRVGARWFH